MTGTSRRLRGILLGVMLVAAAATAVPAQAVTPSRAAAVAAARTVAAKLARETHARGHRVLGCRKSSPIRYVCQIENTFSSGLRRCTATVVVRFKSGRVRTSYSNYVCG